MIRSILNAIMIVVFFIITLPILLFEYVLGKINMKAHDKSCRRMVRFAFNVLRLSTGVKITVLGQENIPKDTACVYVGNHRSYFDIIFPYLFYPGNTAFVAKKEVKKVPILNWWIMSIHSVFLDRDNIREGFKSIMQAIEVVKGGTSVVIFPEGTRNKVNDTFLPFHDGSFKIAEKSGAPVVPMVLINMADIFEDHAPKLKKTNIVIHFLEPVYIKDLSPEEKKHVGEYFQGIISKAYAEDKPKYFN